MSEDYEEYFSQSEEEEDKVDFYELGISNMEDLLSIMTFNRAEKRMREYYNIEDDERWKDFLGFAESQIGEETFKTIKSHEPKEYPLGLALPETKTQVGAEIDSGSLSTIDSDLESLEDEINLIPYFTPIKHQGRRGTCTAHATVALREFMSDKDSIDLSEQFLYWYCKENDGRPNKKGTPLRIAFKGLDEVGVCEESTWPYNPKQTDNEGQGPPPEGAKEEAKKYKIESYEKYDNEDIDGLCALLQEGHPLVFGVPIYPSWQNYATQVKGKVFMPLPNENKRGYHALVLVGYERNEKSPGGGKFIFRNSWGEEWAKRSPYGPGYATIPFLYIKKYSTPLYTSKIKGESDNDIIDYHPELSGKLDPLLKDDKDIILGCKESKEEGLLDESKILDLGVFSEDHKYLNKKVGVYGNYPHIVTVFGQRGTGKSYTLGVIAEELAEKGGEGIVVIDPVGIFHKMKERNEDDLLKEWGIEPKGYRNVRVLGSIRHSEASNIEYDGNYSIKVSDLTNQDWQLIFDFANEYTPQMAAIKKSRKLVTEGYTAEFQGKEIDIPSVSEYSFGDLIQCLKYSSKLKDSEEVSKQTKKAIIRRFRDAAEWDIFTVEGTPIEEISREGEVTILDVSLFEDERYRGIIVGILARKIFNSRKKKEGKIPPTWLIIDEAHILAPSEGKTVASGPLVKYAKEGRAPGCAMVLATQEPASLTNSILKQSNLMITHALSNRDDINAFKYRAPSKLPEGKKMDNLLREIPTGHCLISDRFTQDRTMVVNIRPRKSKHGGKDG